MRRKANFAPSYFGLLLLVALMFIGLGLGVVGWSYEYPLVKTIWHVCQSGLQNLKQHLPLAWRLVILSITSLVIIRGSWSLFRQVQQTRRFLRLFSPLQRAPTPRLRRLLARQGLTTQQVVYLNAPTPSAFCHGFWRPRIWITAGLVNLLTDDELAAVLAHESYHCRQRDPLRLLVSRTLQAAFFFLPMVNDLANLAELQQEINADEAAIARLGDDLPLLSALQKLLACRAGTMPAAWPAVSAFNVTEARLRRLVYAAPLFSSLWSQLLIKWGLTVMVVIAFNGIGYWSTRPLPKHPESNLCEIGNISFPAQSPP